MSAVSIIRDLMNGSLGCDVMFYPKDGPEEGLGPFRGLVGAQDMSGQVGQTSLEQEAVRVELLRSDFPTIKRFDRFRFRYEGEDAWTDEFQVKEVPDRERHGATWMFYVSHVLPPQVDEG
jgi:hypothetical protein